MKKMTEYFFERAYQDDLPKRNLLYNKDKLERLKVSRALTEKEVRILQDINEKLANPALLHSLKWDVNYLSELITQSVRSQTEASVLIFADGRIDVQQHGQQLTEEQKKARFAPHIILSLQYYFTHFIDPDYLSQFLLQAHVYNEDEERVLREMRNKNVHTISISMNGGSLKRIESEKNGQITGEEAQQIKRILGLRNYESITLNTRDKKTHYEIDSGNPGSFILPE
jgi:hypothetical protein